MYKIAQHHVLRLGRSRSTASCTPHAYGHLQTGKSAKHVKRGQRCVQSPLLNAAVHRLTHSRAGLTQLPHW